MFKKSTLILVLVILCSHIFAEEIRNDIIEIKHSQKSVAKAMILSSLFPGTGQFYANRRSFTTYISPVIEIGLIFGYIHYVNEGDNITSDYEDFADNHYERDRQHYVEDKFLTATDNPSYDNHFRLDDTNTQHFYEDIGKYNKYIFGWDDWYEIYADPDHGDPIWVWSSSNFGDNWTWNGNEPTNPDHASYTSNQTAYDNANGKYSVNRAEYIDMRIAAEEEYDKAELFSFAIVANHVAAAIDAYRLTRQYNLESLSAAKKLDIKFAPIMVNNQLSPALFLTKRF